VQPVQLAFHAEAGFVEVCQVSPGDAGGDLAGERAQVIPGRGGGRRYGALGDGGGKQLAFAVRDRDRYWPMYRYTMTARIRGPYWTGAPAPVGASPVLTCPHAQRREMSWCSVTRILIGGRSNTCRRLAPTSVPSRVRCPRGYRRRTRRSRRVHDG